LDQPRIDLVVWFENLRNTDVPVAGGKNASLGEMISAGILVPPGFAVTAYAYKKFIEDTGIAKRIYEIIKESVTNPNDPGQYEIASKKIRQLIESTPMPKDIADAIRSAYEGLCKRLNVNDVYVAVRSSATAEDLPDASFAGQQESFLNTRGINEVLENTIKCWSSLFTPRAIFYRAEKGFAHEKVLISVGVQKMVNSRVAGVMFTINPVTGDTSEIVIEGNYGLGEAVVSGSVTPDDFVVEKNSMKITSRRLARKSIQYIRDPNTGKTVHAEVPPNMQEQQCVTDDEIIKLGEFGRRIEKHYGKAMDIEWAIDKDIVPPNNIFIVQARPETVWSVKASQPPVKMEKAVKPTEAKVVVRGLRLEEELMGSALQE
jgi:pyruvate,water dikinase